MRELQDEFLNTLKRKLYKQKTIKDYDLKLSAFFRFVEENYPDVFEITDITRDIINAYENYLAGRKNEKGNLLSGGRRQRYLSAVKSFFLYLQKEEKIYTNPTVNISYPRVRRKFIRDVLNIDEMAQLIKACAGNSLKGIRDRAILELLYSTGIRSEEMRNISIEDIDLNERTLFVRQGKMGTQRIVPVGESAAYWVRKYLQTVRFYAGEASDILFLTMEGGRKIGADALKDVIKKWAREAGIEKDVTTHTFRHSCATHMLKKGADIRYVQKHLGHKSISTTELYLKIEITDLKEIHERCHPREQEDWDR